MSIVYIKSVKKSFVKKMNDELNFYKKTVTHLEESYIDVDRLSHLTLISSATIWETFLNELIVAYISKDKKYFIEKMKKEYDKFFKGSTKWKYLNQKFAPIISPGDLNAEKIASLVNNQERNISFSNYSTIKQTAEQWLSESNREKITQLDKQSVAVIDLFGALRNKIVHDSPSSTKVLTERASNKNLKHVGLYMSGKQSIRPIRYLKAKSSSNGNIKIRRIEKILYLITEIGNRF